MKKQPKLLIGIIVAVAVIAVVVISIVMMVAGGSRDTYERHMELAQRYLDELKYEQVITEYRAAIVIDPKNEDAYLGLADVYVAMGDTEKALEVLAESYEQTGSARIAARQEELEEELEQKSLQERGDLSGENSDGEGFQPLPAYRASTVPYVVWDTQEDAIAKLREAGLADPVIKTQNDANVAAGKVISQSLDAGTEVDEGTQITIVVSGGPASFEMPIEIIINDYELFTDGFYYEWTNDDNSVSFIDFEKGGISGHFTFSRELTDEEKNWYHGGKILTSSGEDSNIDVRFFATAGVFAAEFPEQLPKGKYIYILYITINNEYCEARIPFTID